MYIEIPKIDVKGMNCKLAMAASILASHKIEYLGGLCNSLCFSYRIEDELIANNLVYGDIRGKSKYLQDLYGLSLQVKEISNLEEFGTTVKERLMEGRTTIIYGSIYNCPFNDKKFPVNYKHFSAINGLNEEEQTYTIYDAFLKKYNITVDIGKINDYVEKYLEYELNLNEAKLDYNNKTELAKYSIQNLLFQSKTEQFDKSTDYLADKLETREGFQSIIEANEEQFYRLSNAFSEMKECNELYISFLQYVIEDKEKLDGLVTTMNHIIVHWQKVVGLVLKVYITKGKDKDIRYSISSTLRNIANLQRELLDNMCKL